MVISPIDIDCPATGCNSKMGFACNSPDVPGFVAGASFHAARQDAVVQKAKQRRTADEFRVKVGDYVSFPVKDANVGWHLVSYVRDVQKELGMAPVAILQKRTVHLWKALNG